MQEMSRRRLACMFFDELGQFSPLKLPQTLVITVIQRDFFGQWSGRVAKNKSFYANRSLQTSIQNYWLNRIKEVICAMRPRGTFVWWWRECRRWLLTPSPYIFPEMRPFPLLLCSSARLPDGKIWSLPFFGLHQGGGHGGAIQERKWSNSAA